MSGSKQSDMKHVQIQSHEATTHSHEKKERVRDRRRRRRQARKDQKCFEALEESIDTKVSNPPVYDENVCGSRGTCKRRARN